MRFRQALLRGFLAFAPLVSAGCSSHSPGTTAVGMSSANPAVNRALAQPADNSTRLVLPDEAAHPAGNGASANIARRILELDAQVKPVTDQMVRTLDDVMKDACAAIGELHGKPDRRRDRRYARAALKCIDDTLIDHGFVYPDAGGVDQLADALTPFQMSAARKHAFEANPHNRRRAAMIAQRFPGPFYALDCDTACFLYLGVAAELGFPLHLVTIPAFNRRPGHVFIRWGEGFHSLDWETMDGVVTTDDFYLKEWKISSAEVRAQCAMTDLSAGQVIGCEHYLIATQYERRGNFERALRELALAFELYPENLDARREFAWATATGQGVRFRHDAEAIADAQFVLRLVDDPDARDTLAAAYASAGMFDLAVKEEKAALRNAQRTGASKPGYQQRLNLYEHHTVFRQSEPAQEHTQRLQP